MIQVVVIDFLNSSARVLVSTEEVQIVGQTPGNFIIWPTRLAKAIVVKVVFILFNIFTQIIFIY